MIYYTNKKGSALLIILIFGAIIATILFVIAQSNTNLSFQNKNTLKSLQSYYLAQSGIQHFKLYLKLMPVDMNRFFENEEDTERKQYREDIKKELLQTLLQSQNFSALNLGAEYSEDQSKFDLFDGKKPGWGCMECPYSGGYKIVDFNYLNENSSLALVQTSYGVKVVSWVYSSIKENGESMPNKDEIYEEFSMARSGR